MLSPSNIHDLVSRSGATASSPGSPGHYVGLDLMRGIAALIVVLFHCSARLDLPYLFPHGYLCVDFFFALSGFVMARAYRERISAGHLPIPRFALMRAIRLMPLIVMGTALAAVVEAGRSGIVDPHRHLVDTAQALVAGSLLVPTLAATTLELAVFPLNAPAWSLFQEAVASAGFALWARLRLRLWALAPLLAASALGLLWGAHSRHEICLGAVPDDFWLGFARTGWSFTLGLVLFRIRDRAPRVPFAVPALLLAAVALTPSLGAADGAFDAACVLLVLPAIVFAASSARFGAVGRRWSTLSGDLSYPVYALHYPVARALGVVGLGLHLPPAGRLGMAALTTGLVVAGSAAAYALADVPVRRWLTARLASRPGYRIAAQASQGAA